MFKLEVLPPHLFVLSSSNMSVIAFPFSKDLGGLVKFMSQGGLKL